MQMLIQSFSFLYAPGLHWAVQELDVLSFHAPGARREHQTGLLKGSSPMLSPACVLAAMRVIFHLCLIFLQQKM